jgi:serine/threonine protein phosphatase 1
MKFSKKILPPETGNRWVIADVHGFRQTLEALIDQLHLSKQDQLFFLGDYISRGPEPAGVLDYIIKLQNQKFQVYCLRGNHEDMFMEDWTYFSQIKISRNISNFRDVAQEYNNESLLEEDGWLIPKYENFMENLSYYFDLGDFYLVHAGFQFSSSNYLQDSHSLLWMRNFPQFDTSLIPFTDKKIVVGHSIVKLSLIRERIAQKHPIIPLDNGPYYQYFYKNQPEFQLKDEVGNLCAFNLNTWELKTQRCID